MNVLHNIVHLVFGVWGLAVYRRTGAAIGYARTVAIVYALFMVMGFIPGLDTVFGLVPLHGNDVWLHALLAAGEADEVMISTLKLPPDALRSIADQCDGFQVPVYLARLCFDAVGSIRADH